MEKIIDRILSRCFGESEIHFNTFVKNNNLDKSNRSVFKSSLENKIKELSSERDQIIIPESKTEKFERINTVTNWYSNMSEWDRGNPLNNNSKTFRTYDSEKVKKDKKRKAELNTDILILDCMLQIVNLYPADKENTPTKENENNVPGLIQFDEPIYSHLEQLKGNISRWKKNKSSDDTIKSNIKLQNERFYKKHMNDKEFTQLFKGGYKYFLQLIYPSLKPSFGFEWKLNAFVKTHENKYSPKKK